MNYFFVVGDDGFIARCHACGDDDLQNFLSSIDIKIQVSKEEFDLVAHERRGRFKVNQDGSYSLFKDCDNLEIVMAQTRAKRDQLLQQSDWTQLPDVPLATKEAWAVYRQALRDITQQPDPFNIAWPVAPG